MHIDAFRDSINQVVERNITLDVDTLLQGTMDMISHQHGQFDILSMLQNMREYDDSTFSHSLNVALICNVLATWLRWDKEDVKLATGCGLFHDIGKNFGAPCHYLQAGKTVPQGIQGSTETSLRRLPDIKTAKCG